MASKILSRVSQALQKKKTLGEQAGFTESLSARKGLGLGSVVNSRYRLMDEIGRGGMGIVYRAQDILNNREVALKIINLDKANLLSLQQFSREAKIASGLEHPHIVRVFETGTVEAGAQESSPYIVMEFVRGKSLNELGPLTYTRTLELAGQICEALGYAHTQGFVHRDLKPGNVIVEKRGFQYFVKLMDFGLARPLGADNLPMESNLAGTVFYLAPEVIAGQPADIRSDLYALGAMLYEMVTGRVPFSDFIDDQAILMQHLQEPVIPPSQSRRDVPPALEMIIMRLLEKDPAKRFASVQDVHEALKQVKVREEAGLNNNLPGLTIDISACKDQAGQIINMLETNQLVTILGEDDTLALATATQLIGQFPDGAWRVDFRSADSPAVVLSIVASTLGVSADPNRPLAVSLVETLREKHLLMLLSHFGHLHGACRQLVETILHSCPEVNILATSPRPFNLPTEKCYPT